MTATRPSASAGGTCETHLQAWNDLHSEGVDIVAVCDVDPAEARAAAEIFGIPRWFTGRWQRCLAKLVTTCRWTEAKCVRDGAGIETLRRHLKDMIDYLKAKHLHAVNDGARRRREDPFPLRSSKVWSMKSCHAG